ncbi:hypothetical protein J6590_089230 [Homalodisca vitripennis]|nr:hypothetical protein J6590_089230 [Homalodisca vitripennis]
MDFIITKNEWIIVEAMTLKCTTLSVSCRYDLPRNHAVNQHTCIIIVNFFIEELCVQYEGVELLEFNSIGIRWFNQPRQLSAIARQEAAGRSCGGCPQSLRSVDCCTPASAPDCSCCLCRERPSSQPVSRTSQATSPLSPALPRTLPQDSLAEAVKSGGKAVIRQPDHSPSSNKTVLGTAIFNDGLNFRPQQI